MSFPWVAFVLFALLSITLLSPGSSRFPRRTHSGGKVDGATPRVSAGQVNDLSPTADFIIGSGNTGVVFRACKTACGEESTVCADGGVMVEQTVGGGGFSSADLKALGLNALTKNKFTSIDTATLQALGAYVPYSAGWSWVVVSRNTEEPACFRWEPDDESNNMGPPSFPNARTLRSKDTKFEPPVNSNGVAQLNRKNVGLLLTRRGFEAVVLLANYESRIDLSGSAELFSNLRQVAGIALAAAVDLMENHVGAEGPGGGADASDTSCEVSFQGAQLQRLGSCHRDVFVDNVDTLLKNQPEELLMLGALAKQWFNAPVWNGKEVSKRLIPLLQPEHRSLFPLLQAKLKNQRGQDVLDSINRAVCKTSKLTGIPVRILPVSPLSCGARCMVVSQVVDVARGLREGGGNERVFIVFILKHRICLAFSKCLLCTLGTSLHQGCFNNKK